MWTVVMCIVYEASGMVYMVDHISCKVAGPTRRRSHPNCSLGRPVVSIEETLVVVVESTFHCPPWGGFCLSDNLCWTIGGGNSHWSRGQTNTSEWDSRLPPAHLGPRGRALWTLHPRKTLTFEGFFSSANFVCWRERIPMYIYMLKIFLGYDTYKELWRWLWVGYCALCTSCRWVFVGGFLWQVMVVSN